MEKYLEKCILCKFWNTLAEYFEALGQKVEVLLSIFCGTKIQNYFGMDYAFLDLPPNPQCLTHPLAIKFFFPPTLTIQYFEISVPPPPPPPLFVTEMGERVSSYGTCIANLAHPTMSSL